jgi:hypothetical protein
MACHSLFANSLDISVYSSIYVLVSLIRSHYVILKLRFNLPVCILRSLRVKTIISSIFRSHLRLTSNSSTHVERRVTTITLQHFVKFSFWNFPSCVGCPAQNVEEDSIFYLRWTKFYWATFL